jgi:hypothetical protein
MSKNIINKIVTKKTTCKAGHFYDEKHYDEIINNDANIYWIDELGNKKILFKIRKNVIDHKLCDLAFDVFKSHSKAAHNNRGYASGVFEDGKVRQIVNKTSRSKGATSNISGYFDRPYQQIQKYFDTKTVCRMTRFTRLNKEKFESTIPFFEKINSLYKKLDPKAYKLQHENILLVPPNMKVGNTVFTTITSNYNWRSACHQDKGDYENGLGNLTVTGDEEWKGCYIGFPEFKVAVNLRKGDFILMDVHQYHCNTEIKNITKNKGARLSFVCYLRKNMIYCNKKKVINGETYYYKG